jgi:hypothetical protein
MQPLFAALILFAAATVTPAPAPIAPMPKSPPPAFGSALSAGGFGAPLQSRPGFGQLQGLPNASDPTPQCRATCVKNRAICGDDAECGDQWRQCVTACATQAR